MKNYVYSLLIIFTFNACEGDLNTKMISVNERYTISIPADMSESSELNDDASLQYEDMWEDSYVIVIDESKQEMQQALEMFDMTDGFENNLDNYSDIVMDGFLMEMDEQIEHIVDTIINNMSAKVAKLTMSTVGDNFEDIEVHYAMAVVEGKEHYYQVMVWTLAENEIKYSQKIDNILYSLKEISADIKATELQ